MDEMESTQEAASIGFPQKKLYHNYWKRSKMNGKIFKLAKWKSEEREGMPNKLLLIYLQLTISFLLKMNARCIRRIKFQLSRYLKIK